MTRSFPFRQQPTAKPLGYYRDNTGTTVHESFDPFQRPDGLRVLQNTQAHRDVGIDFLYVVDERSIPGGSEQPGAEPDGERRGWGENDIAFA